MGAKSSTMSASLTEACATEHNAVQANGFASPLHLQELFFFLYPQRVLYEC